MSSRSRSKPWFRASWHEHQPELTQLRVPGNPWLELLNARLDAYEEWCKRWERLFSEALAEATRESVP